MGLFSWDCEVCGHALLSHEATQEKNGWMTDAVAIERDGSVLCGGYDGYGRLNDRELERPQVYHKRCWQLAGKPTEFVKESHNSNDRGWFFDDDAHNYAPPKTIEDAKKIKS